MPAVVEQVAVGQAVGIAVAAFRQRRIGHQRHVAILQETEPFAARVFVENVFRRLFRPFRQIGEPLLVDRERRQIALFGKRVRVRNAPSIVIGSA